MSASIRARDLELLDAVDAFRRQTFVAPVWRVVRDGRDPTMGGPSLSRWGNGTFDVLYTSLARDAAVAEIHSFLSQQPVFPSKLVWKSFELKVALDRSLRLADLSRLERLGVNVGRYQERNYAGTQAIADAAYFLDFDGLVAPSPRWNCLNLMVFSGRVAPERIELVADFEMPIDWSDWRRRNR